jgi:hypothetical protein
VTTRDVVNVNLTQARGEVIGPVDVRTLRVAEGATVIRRDLDRQTLGTATGGGGAVVSAGILERAGVYLVNQAGREDAVSGVLAVNMASSAESEVWVRRALPLGESKGRQIEASREPRALWRMFVLAGLLLAMLEWMLGVLLFRR